MTRTALVGDGGAHGVAQRLAAHLARHRLVVAVRRGPERLAAALPLRGADRALARTAGALLLPRLLAAARDLAAPLGVVGADTPVGQLAHDRLVQQRRLISPPKTSADSSSVPACFPLASRTCTVGIISCPPLSAAAAWWS
jgi:hypothetical protein